MKVIASYRKDTVAVCLMVPGGVMLRNSFSDFPSTNYANFYSTKRKSVKMPSEGFITKTYFIFADLSARKSDKIPRQGAAPLLAERERDNQLFS